MKKSICLYFQVHQPTRLRLYRFFDIGKDSHYYDDFADRTILQRIARRCYLPMNKLLLDLIEKHKGDFKVTFSITGYEKRFNGFSRLDDDGEHFTVDGNLILYLPSRCALVLTDRTNRK